MKLVLVVALALSISGCLIHTKPTVDEDLIQLRIDAAVSKYVMPEVLLTVCQKKVPYDKDGDLLRFEHVHRINAERERECRITHNAWVDAYRLIDTPVSKLP